MIIGIDVSSHQGTIDWQAVASDPQQIKFAIIRFGGGVTAFDTRAGQNWHNAKAAGILAMPYWYFVENLDGRAQADAFVDRFAAVAGEPMVACAWDYERNDNEPNSKSRERFQESLYRTWYRTGIEFPIIYTSETKWEELISLGGDAPAWSSLCPLWVAHYGTDYPAIPDGWLDWVLHQYTSSGRVQGIAGNVDINRFRASLQSLKLLFGRFPRMGQRVYELEKKVKVLERASHVHPPHPPLDQEVMMVSELPYLTYLWSKVKGVLGSRKFWAALGATLVVLGESGNPDVTATRVTAIWIAFIFGTAYEDAHSK